VIHERFSTVPVSANVRGWQGFTWAATCKDCDWRGPEHLHPLDCGGDAIAHMKTTTPEGAHA
jgi:hypothetical protein